LLLFFGACAEDYQPKPHGYFRIGLPGSNYNALNTNCDYTFNLNTDAYWLPKDNCWGDVRYPSIKANVQLTYKAIHSDQELGILLNESQDLAYKHASNADGIGEKQYENRERNVYGILYSMQGNSASSTQFFVTDSTTHFLRGVLYFYSVPNADSLKPVNEFMYNEMVQLIESLEWKSSLP
jgi:gliding motility-associated lipoprotein GldD